MLKVRGILKEDKSKKMREIQLSDSGVLSGDEDLIFFIKAEAAIWQGRGYVPELNYTPMATIFSEDDMVVLHLSKILLENPQFAGDIPVLNDVEGADM